MVAMLRLEGLKHREIASRLDMSVISVRKSWHQTINHVRDELGVIKLKTGGRVHLRVDSDSQSGLRRSSSRKEHQAWHFSSLL